MPMTPEDLAAVRYNGLLLVRIVGAMVAIAGMAILDRPAAVEPHQAIGGGLFLIGLFTAIWLPIILKRRWRTPG